MINLSMVALFLPALMLFPANFFDGDAEEVKNMKVAVCSRSSSTKLSKRCRSLITLLKVTVESATKRAEFFNLPNQYLLRELISRFALAPSSASPAFRHNVLNSKR